MGQQASTPQPGKRIQVIGAGLSRTGTTSFSAALSILLDSPVYHCGTQNTMGPPVEIQSWISILRSWASGDRERALSPMDDRLDGYVAVTDAPAPLFVPELLELYPDAMWDRVHGTEKPYGVAYQRHLEWLKEVVPADRLMFFDVKEGWGPLCAALGKDVPDVPFPRINDSEAIDRTAQYHIKRGLMRWAGAVALIGTAAVWFTR